MSFVRSSVPEHLSWVLTQHTPSAVKPRHQTGDPGSRKEGVSHRACCSGQREVQEGVRERDGAQEGEKRQEVASRESDCMSKVLDRETVK